MKRHLQGAEQVKPPPLKLTKYCACHEILTSRFQREIPEGLPPIERTIRGHSEHTIFISHPAASETFPVRSWRRFFIEKYNISRSGYLPKCHEMLRLPRKVTLQLHQVLRLPRKMHSTLLYCILSKHLFSRHLFSLSIHSLYASIL